MRNRIARRGWLGALLCVLALGAGAPGARAEAGDPLFRYYGSEAEDGAFFKPFPPGNGFEGACGVAVDSQADFYVADYYHGVVDVISPARHYLTQLADPALSPGPCGVAVGPSGTLYVSNFHGAVARYSPSSYPPTAETSYGSGTTIDPGPSTGVAVDPGSGLVYVDDRDSIAVYEASGAPVEVEGAPLRIGAGDLVDSYGVALGEAAGETLVYVADAGTDTIKVFEPGVDALEPVAEIGGGATPSGAFSSLRDAALAVDRQSGEVYVTDLLQPEGYERPEAAVYAFAANGSYLGRLKRNVVDALPAGLAVDNSAAASKGRVYVTTGNSEGASVYAYRPGEASPSPPVCAPEGPCPAAAAAGSPLPLVASLATASMSPAASGASGGASAGIAPRRGGSGGGVTVQKGTLRIRVSARLSPRRLPRHGRAPVSLAIAGSVSTTDGSEPPRLTRMRIEFNRHGAIDAAGLPKCPYGRIRTASTRRASTACRGALVGSGRFHADVVLGGQEPYPSEGKMLLFNGVQHGRPVIFGHIYSPHPFASSFVIVFALGHTSHGAYGTVLTADLPRALGNWGYLTGIQMRIWRRFSHRGVRRSYLSAGCPAPKGFTEVPFPLARTSFEFAGSGTLRAVETSSCRVRGR